MLACIHKRCSMANMDLKTARRIAQMTQAQLAERAGVDASLLSLVENGKKSIQSVGYGNVLRIARALNVEPHELFPLEEKERESA